MKSFQNTVCPGHNKVTVGYHLLPRSPKGSLKHWTLLNISIVPGGLSIQEKQKRAHQFLKSAIEKITRETSLGWKEALPTALLYIHIAPKEQAGLSPYEMLYGRPFVYVNDLFLDPEAQTFQSYTMAVRQLQQNICLWAVNMTQKIKESPLYAPGTQVLLKSGKMGPQRLNSSPQGRALLCNSFYPHSSQGTRT